MNVHCRPVSLTDSGIHLSTSPSSLCRLSGAGQPAQRQQDCDDRLNAAVFERLLHWLGPDPDTAGCKYESIRARLIMMFKARRCVFAEDLADATFERVENKLTSLTTEFIGDPTPYFYAVAKKIYLEYLRKLIANQRKLRCLSLTNIDNSDSENMLNLLDKALSRIPRTDRELILRYYMWNGKNKLNDRRALAKQLGIKPNALRLRVFRIRKEIKNNLVRT